MTGLDGSKLVDMAIGAGRRQSPRPQGPTSILDAIAADMGRQAVGEAQGWGEQALFHGLNFSKSLADGTANLGGLVWQGLRAAGSTIADFDPAEGWEAGAQDIERLTGSRSPSFLDYADLGISAVTGQPRMKGLGEETEKMIQERLGRGALFSGAAGTLASFATGPGALVGKVGAKAAAPLAHVAERYIARSVAKGAMTREAADALISSGQFWTSYAKDLGPGVGIYKRLLAAGGRNVETLFGVTAGNVLQSYALGGEDQRVDGAISALVTSPFLVPISRLGSSLANWATKNSISPDDARAAMGIYDRMAKGELSPSAANNAFREVLPRHYRALNALISGAFEGTAFTALDPQGKERWAKAIGGDTDAMKELLLTAAGSVTGLAAIKYGMPADLAPMFRQIRPELDTLQLRIEAEAVKQAAEAVKQAPQDPTKLTAEQRAAELDRLLMTKQEALQKKFNSYTVLTEAPIRAGWEPTFDADSLGLMFGDSKVKLSRTGDSLTLTLDQKSSDALAEVGITETVLTGPDAQNALDKLTLLALRGEVIASQRLQGIGFQEVDGRWVLPEEGVEAKPNLDGSTTLVDVYTGEPTGRAVPVPTLDPAPVRFEHPTLAQFAETVYAKQALSPDPVIDPILVGAINEAVHGDGPGADVLREFFSSVPPQELLSRLKTGEDDALAYWLGAAVRGHGNAKSMLEGIRRQMESEQADQEFVARATQEPVEPPAQDSDMALSEIDKITAADAQRQAEIDAAEAGLEVTQPARRRTDVMDKPTGQTERPVRMAAPEDRVEISPVKYEKVDRRRSGLRDELAKATGIAAGVRVSSQQAKVVGKFVGNSTSLGKALAEIAASGGVAKIDVDAADLIKFSQSWSKFAPRMRMGSAQPDLMQNQIASVDAWLESAAAKLGVAPPPASRFLAQKVSGPEAPPNPGRPEGELYRGDVSAEPQRDPGYEVYGGLPIPKAVAEEARATGRSFYDILLESAPEALRKAVPDSQLPDMIRRSSSEGRQLEAQVKGAAEAWEIVAKKIKKALNEQVTVEGQPYAKPRWMALAQGEIEPRNKNERLVAEGLDSTLKSLWNAGVDMGVMNVRQSPETSDLEWLPITKRDRSVVPREYHPEYYDEIMAKEPVRLAYFEEIASKNEIRVRDKETGQVRRATGADLEAKFREANETGGQIVDPEKSAALEHIRQLKNIPMEFQGKKVLEPDTFRAMRNIIGEQAARLGTIKVMGQDLPAFVRKKYGITKLGVSTELKNFNARTTDRGIQDLAISTVGLIQGRQPRESRGATKLIRATTLGPIEGLTRAVSTISSWVQDLTPLHWGASTGYARMAKAIAQVATSPKEAAIAAERSGALMRDMGPLEVGEADTSFQKFVDLFAWTGKASEKLKTIVAAKLADVMLADWKRGRVTANDRGVVRDMLRFSQADMDALTSGKASEALQTQFRQEMTQFLTDRTPQALASQFAQSPNMMRLFRFARWATGRMRNVARTMVAYNRASKYGTPAEKRAAAWRMFNTGLGLAVGGTLGQALSYIWVDMFRDPLDPSSWAKRWWQEFSYAPSTMVGRALRNQLIGGPFAQVVSAAIDANDPRAWASVTAPGAVAFKIAESFESQPSPTTAFEFFDAMAKGIGKAATGTVVPRELVAAAASMSLIGKDRDIANFARRLNSFERLEGIERPEFQREKSEAFYEAMADVRTAMAKHPDDREAALKEAMVGVKAALALEPSASVASAIRARRFLAAYDNERRDKFADFIGDDKVMEKAYEHDAALSELARIAGKMEGTESNAFEAELEMVKEQARLGGADRWRGLADRAVEEASQALLAGARPTDDLRELSMALARFPEHAEAVFSERQARAIANRRLGIGARARMIYGVLASRAKNRARDDMRERAKERR